MLSDLENKYKIAIYICSKDRPTELFGLLQSLRTQTHQNWNLYIMDDRSGVPIQNHSFIQSIINRLKLENHIVTIWRNEIPLGVTRLRQMVVNKIMDVGNENTYARMDDDKLLNPDFLERLCNALEQGYDIAGCLVPHCAVPFIKRENKYVKPFISDVKLNERGEIVYFGDDCGMEYMEKEIIPSVNFRSMALIKKDVHRKIKYEDNLGFCSFREEQWFSFKAILEGFKICVDTGAIAYHLATPSGGERTQQYSNGLQTNHELLSRFTQKIYAEKGDFLQQYKDKILKEIK
jgi:glycosyltransferase involved in cell wall biosynthesis